jgi:hypothetical protein
VEERVRRIRFEPPIVRHAFESAITKIKEKVASRCAVTDCHPIGWLISERIRSYYLIEFTPSRRKIAVAALAAIPPLVVCATESIARASDKPDYSTIVLVEMLEHESVEKKEEQDIAAASLCARLGGIWLCVPPPVELDK